MNKEIKMKIKLTACALMALSIMSFELYAIEPHPCVPSSMGAKSHAGKVVYKNVVGKLASFEVFTKTIDRKVYSGGYRPDSRHVSCDSEMERFKVSIPGSVFVTIDDGSNEIVRDRRVLALDLYDPGCNESESKIVEMMMTAIEKDKPLLLGYHTREDAAMQVLNCPDGTTTKVFTYEPGYITRANFVFD